jgi:hypothetical protein
VKNHVGQIEEKEATLFLIHHADIEKQLMQGTLNDIWGEEDKRLGVGQYP